jgi:hypothetical protein
MCGGSTIFLGKTFLIQEQSCRDLTHPHITIADMIKRKMQDVLGSNEETGLDRMALLQRRVV